MRQKKLIAMLIAVVLLVSSSCFAAGEDRIFTNIKMYTGNVWLLNDENNTVILQNVKTKNAFGRDELVIDLEYKAVPIIPQNIFSASGEPLSFETVNAYLLDSKVTFVAGTNAYGYKVLYMEIQ